MDPDCFPIILRIFLTFQQKYDGSGASLECVDVVLKVIRMSSNNGAGIDRLFAGGFTECLSELVMGDILSSFVWSNIKVPKNCSSYADSFFVLKVIANKLIGTESGLAPVPS